MKCNIQTGTLVSHRCGRKAEYTCSSCNEKVCQRHFNLQQGKCVCCTGEYIPVRGVIQVGDLFSFDDSDYAAFERENRDEENRYLDS